MLSFLFLFLFLFFSIINDRCYAYKPPSEIEKRIQLLSNQCPVIKSSHISRLWEPCEIPKEGALSLALIGDYETLQLTTNLFSMIYGGNKESSIVQRFNMRHYFHSDRRISTNKLKNDLYKHMKKNLKGTSICIFEDVMKMKDPKFLDILLTPLNGRESYISVNNEELDTNSVVFLILFEINDMEKSNISTFASWKDYLEMKWQTNAPDFSPSALIGRITDGYLFNPNDKIAMSNVLDCMNNLHQQQEKNELQRLETSKNQYLTWFIFIFLFAAVLLIIVYGFHIGHYARSSKTLSKPKKKRTNNRIQTEINDKNDNIKKDQQNSVMTKKKEKEFGQVTQQHAIGNSEVASTAEENESAQDKKGNSNPTPAKKAKRVRRPKTTTPMKMELRKRKTTTNYKG